MNGIRSYRSLMIAVAISLFAVPQAFGLPNFYLSDQPLGIAHPSKFVLSDQPSAATRQLYIYVTTDVRLAAVSLDLMEEGTNFKFTGVNVVNGGRWAFLDAPLSVQNTMIQHIGGAGSSAIGGFGIGPGAPPDANFNATSGYLLATLNYQLINAPPLSRLYLKVGGSEIADWDFNATAVIFGRPSDPPTLDIPGSTDGFEDGLYFTPEPVSFGLFASALGAVVAFSGRGWRRLQNR